MPKAPQRRVEQRVGYHIAQSFDPLLIRTNIDQCSFKQRIEINDDSRERCLALLDVLALGARPGLPAEVDGDAHEEPALVEEVACDVDAHQQQEEDDDQDAHDGSGAQA